MRESLDERAVTELGKTEEVFSGLGIEGRASVAESSASPRLLRTQRRLEAEASGSTLNVLARRKPDLSNEIINENRFRPEITGQEPEAIFDISTGRLVAVRQRVNEAVTVAEVEQRNVSAVVRESDRVERGVQIRDQRDELRRDVQRTFETEANDAGFNDLERAFDFKAFRDNIVERFFIAASRFADDAKPRVMLKIKKEADRVVEIDETIARIQAKEEITEMDQISLERLIAERTRLETATFEDLKTIRTAISDEWVEAITAGRLGEARTLTRFERSFDEYFDSIQPRDPSLSATWGEFRTRYRLQFIDRFDKGTAYLIGQRGRRATGEYRIRSELVADQFLRSESTAQDYRRLFSDPETGQMDPQSYIAIRAAILDRLARTNILDDAGLVNERSLDRWIRRTPFLRAFPEIRSELQNLAGTTRALSERTSQLRQRGILLDKSALSTALRGDVDTFVDSALRNLSVAKTVANTARREGKTEALTATVWARAMREIQTPEGELPNPANLLKWIDQHRPSLEVMLPGSHLEAIKRIYSGLTIVQRSGGIPTGAEAADSPLERLRESTGASVNTILSRAFNAESGRIGYRFVGGEALARFLNTKAIQAQNAMLYEALFDEKLARDLANMTGKPILTPANERRLNAWLFTIGMAEGQQRFEE